MPNFIFGLREVVFIRPNSELTVITKAKDLLKYVFVISETAPKKFRFSLVGKMQSVSLDVLENLVLANEIILGDNAEDNRRRKDFQHMTIAKLNILDALGMAAREQQCILPRQYEVLSRLISDCLRLTGAWINSDKKRIT